MQISDFYEYRLIGGNRLKVNSQLELFKREITA